MRHWSACQCISSFHLWRQKLISIDCHILRHLIITLKHLHLSSNKFHQNIQDGYKVFVGPSSPSWLDDLSHTSLSICLFHSLFGKRLEIEFGLNLNIFLESVDCTSNRQYHPQLHRQLVVVYLPQIEFACSKHCCWVFPRRWWWVLPLTYLSMISISDQYM